MHAVAQMAMIEAYLGNSEAAMTLARQAVEDDSSHPYLFYFLSAGRDQFRGGWDSMIKLRSTS